MRGAGRTARLRLPLIPLVLALLALLDLRTEFQLLLDHFTITSLVEIPHHHPLAIAVLFCTPWLWKQSR
jgi:hypothetical protein